jgi:hypothetical protein
MEPATREPKPGHLGPERRHGVRRNEKTPLAAYMGRVSRASPVHAAVRNCTRDEGGPFGFGNQVLIPSRREPLRSKAVVVSVAEKTGHDSVRYG